MNIQFLLGYIVDIVFMNSKNTVSGNWLPHI